MKQISPRNSYLRVQPDSSLSTLEGSWIHEDIQRAEFKLIGSRKQLEVTQSQEVVHCLGAV